MNTSQIIIISVLFWSLYISNTPSAWATPPNGLLFDTHFKGAESMYNLPPGLLSRMAYQESRYNPNARGSSGEIGIMQITPRWHPGVNASDPKESIYYAGHLMRQYYNEFKRWDAAIAAYNWGETNVRNKGIARAPETTQRYIRDVLRDIGA